MIGDLSSTMNGHTTDLNCPLLHGLVEKFDLSMKSLTIINIGSNVGLNYQHQFFGRGCGEGIHATDS